MKFIQYKNLDFAKIDFDRKRRKGFPEVIYCKNKTREQIKKIAQEFVKDKSPLLLTRLEKGVYQYLKKSYPRLQYNQSAKAAYLIPSSIKIKKQGFVLIITGGTSDIPVAEEAAVTLKLTGNKVKALYDVGVAGVHRLFDNIELIRRASVVIVLAGMEGALAGLVAGLVAAPVIAVPTSFGYGANFGGLSSLLTMLNSCSPGMAVVNIDNGFGAGYFANLINR
jgi:hypothetical protein